MIDRMFSWEAREAQSLYEDRHRAEKQRDFLISSIARLAETSNETNPFVAAALLDIIEDCQQVSAWTPRKKQMNAHVRTAIIELPSGAEFDLLNPDPARVKIEDIAYTLAGIYRFGAKSIVRYTVAQHSVRVADRLVIYRDPTLALIALLHDAAEAYTGDIVRPMKEALPILEHFERRIQQAVWAAFGLAPTVEQMALVRHADESELLGEARQFMASGGRTWRWPAGLHIDDSLIVPLDPAGAEVAFMNRFKLFTARRTELR